MRWTVMNEPAVERQLSEAAAQLTDAISEALPATRLRVAAIIGGYGRGEGGVEESDAGFKPHNNLDVLVVSTGRECLDDSLQASLRTAMDGVAARCGIPVDLGCVTEHQLHSSRPRIMWYDVRKGHRVLCGDPSFLSKLDRYRHDNIPVDDVIDLVTNRGALAVIAKELMLAEGPSPWAVRQALKGTMKAIVGYGDAMLWQRGLYHASYQEKACRMAGESSLDEGLRTLYAEAIAFRFQPDYRRYQGREQRWVLAAIEHLERSHQTFALSLFGELGAWPNYAESLLRLCLKERGVRGWISHLRAESRNYWVLGVPPKRAETWLERASLERHRLAAALPSALFQASSQERREFIRNWASECDANFPTRLGKELNLDSKR